MPIGVHVCYSNTAGAASISTSSKNTVSTTTGSTIIAFCTAFGDDFHVTTPMSDSAGNTWALVGTEQVTGGLKHRCYRAYNITGSATHTFTTQFTTAGGYGALYVCEVTGVSVSPTIVQSQGEATASPYVSPNVAPAASSVLLGYFCGNPSSGTEVDTWGGSFASGDKIESYGDADNRQTGSMAASVKSAAGTFNASVTISGVTISTSAVFAVAVLTGTPPAAALPPAVMRYLMDNS